MRHIELFHCAILLLIDQCRHVADAFHPLVATRINPTLLCRNGASDPVHDSSELCSRLGLEDAFDRWRYIQKLLDYETDADDTNTILFHVLQGYLRKEYGERSQPVASPERTRERVDMVTKVLAQQPSTDASIHVLPADDSNTEICEQLQALLPDPLVDEDDHKSIWDAIREIHGNEAVKIDEKNGGPEWRARCMVAQVLLHFDFLQKGV